MDLARNLIGRINVGDTLTRTVDGVTTTFVYDINNRVTSANNPSTNEIYWYDGNGTRVAKLVNNTALTAYFAGGSYEITGTSVRKYYSFGGTSIELGGKRADSHRSATLIHIPSHETVR